MFTGCHPFKHIRRELGVMAAVNRGKTPERPEEIAVYSKKPDLLWELLGQCWMKQPAERPTARQLRSRFQSLTWYVGLFAHTLGQTTKSDL